jgi:hypothetical protein
MVFNTTFNNISLISWWSVLLVEETGVPRENHQPEVPFLASLTPKVKELTRMLLESDGMV